ncbi:MAG: hypothetical protein IKN85_01625, partial [Oscillospiraceae bacterium]|nr:hypothetical protein [Oscillospiraceae bacterium]MBR6834495.1 hypothetical protein [Oscillospiraceae bacterium]
MEGGGFSMMQFLCVAFVMYISVILGKGLRKNSPQEAEQEERSTEPYSELSRKIDELNRCRNGIDEISEMIADITSCSPGKVAKTVSVKILESGREYDFLLNGEDLASELMLELLNSERDDLNTSLRSRIKKIS